MSFEHQKVLEIDVPLTTIKLIDKMRKQTGTVRMLTQMMKLN
ncbi:TPA: hypothetical protein ACMD2S_001492 [Vibrio parahaemolyticus]